LQRLKAQGLYTDEKYSHVAKISVHYKAWRAFVGEYFEVDPADAKLMLIKLGYGARQTAEIPFLTVLAAQMRLGAAELLRIPGNTWVNDFYSDRTNPLFSRLCALLSSDEADLLIAYANEAQRYSPTIINGYLFDGAENYCTTIEDAAVVQYAAEKTTNEFGVELCAKTWPHKFRSVGTLTYTLLTSGQACVTVRDQALLVSPRACLISCLVGAEPELRELLVGSSVDINNPEGMSVVSLKSTKNSFRVSATRYASSRRSLWRTSSMIHR
jgi:hypothetical protein